MRRDFIKKLNQFTSLLLATVFFLCSHEAVVNHVLAAGDNVTEAVEVRQNVEDEEQAYLLDDDEETEEYAVNYEMEETPEEEYNSVEENYSLVTVEPEEVYSAVIYSTSVYTITDDDRNEYETTTEFTINTVEDWLKIEALSREYNFEGKKVLIATPRDDTLGGKYILTGTGFTGLGCMEKPFAGTLQTYMSGVSVNCDCPLVAYMSSKATVEQLVLGMSGGNAGIAGTLIFESEEDTTMLLKGITVTGYLDGGEEDGVGGLFGTVINNTEYKFTIDAAKVSQGEADNWGGINMEFSEHDGLAAVAGKNVGTFIGKMVGNVSLNVNEDFHISVPSLYGTESTGSIVGRMEFADASMASLISADPAASVLQVVGDPALYPTIHFSEWSGFSVKNIKGTGYNGGVIGYANHANIINDTGEDVLEINDTKIEGGKAAGGFIGYAAYTTINGTGMGEIKIDNSEFSCVLSGSANALGEGVTGGFVGIYSDGNSLFNKTKITLDNLTFNTAQYSGSDSVVKYMGGFIGKYISRDDIVITPESEMVSISNIYFKIRATNTYCGGFVSHVPSSSGNLNIDTKLKIDNVYMYMRSDTSSQSFQTYGFGGISSLIESDELTIKNISISNIQANIGQYIGAAVGKALVKDSHFENLNISGFVLKNKLDSVSDSYSVSNSYRHSYGTGSLTGQLTGNTKIKNVNVSDVYMQSYLSVGIDDSIKREKYGYGGLIGILGNKDNTYTVDTIEGVSISGQIDVSAYYYGGYTRHYTGGLIGYVHRKTAVQLDDFIDFSNITKYSVANVGYSGKLIGAHRDALIYMQPACVVTYSDVFSDRDEIANYGGIYRNETFWDNPYISESSVSSPSGTYLIEQDSSMESGIRINGSVGAYDGGWGLSTLGDYMRFSIVNNTAGNYGLEAFGTDDYQALVESTFTVMNDIDLSARYSGIVTLNRNDLWYDNSTDYNNFQWSKMMFRGTFRGKEGENPRITLPGFPVYRQYNLGLFANAIGATFKDFTITGTFETTQLYTGNALGSISKVVSEGALVANAYNNITVENVTVDNVNTKAYETLSSGNIYVGKLIGCLNYFTRKPSSLTSSDYSQYLENYDYTVKSIGTNNTITADYAWSANINNITVKDGSCEIQGNNNIVRTGELIGQVTSRDTYTDYSLNLDNILIQNETTTSQSTSAAHKSGFINSIYGYDGHRIQCNFNDVKLDNVEITTVAANEIGGLWGYIWNHADVKVTYARNTDKVAIKDCGIYMNNATSKNNIFGGLLYQYQNAYMDLTEGFTIDGLTLSAPNSTRDNCAFIVSYSQTSMIFLKDYKLINAKVIFAGKMFDEISGKTKDNNELNAAQSNMGIISLADSQTPYSIKKEDYHTYAYQGDYSECPNMQKPYYNAYTRYYYNLDDVVKKVEEDPIESFKININGVDYQTLNIKNS